MATSTMEDKQQTNGRESQREIEEQQQAFADARRATENAIETLVNVWAGAVTTFVPEAVLRPIAAVDTVFEAVQQLLLAQRSLVEELLGTTGEFVDRSDLVLAPGRYDGERRSRRAAAIPA